MPMWRCPHCGAPQPEAARCWVCRRSSTTCSTCRDFRRAVAGRMGYCGQDRRRTPISGLEMRGCWQAPRVGPAIGPDAGDARDPVRGATERGTRWVPVMGEGTPDVRARLRRDFEPPDVESVEGPASTASTPSDGDPAEPDLAAALADGTLFGEPR